jgi:hypothetical protein
VMGVALNRVPHGIALFRRFQRPRRLVVTTKRLLPLVKKMLNQKSTVDIQR